MEVAEDGRGEGAGRAVNGGPGRAGSGEPWSAVVTNLRVAVDLGRSPPVTLVTLELVASGEPAVGMRPEAGRLLLVLEGAVLNHPPGALTVADGLVEAVAWRGPEPAGPGSGTGSAGGGPHPASRVEVEVAVRLPAEPRVFWRPGLPGRLVLEIPREAVTCALAGTRVGLDPGHGGRDGGARGGRYREADVVLEFSRRLARWLRSHGVSVPVTRDRDETVSVETRIRLARRERPDAFVSFHAGASTDRRRRGTAVLHRGDPPSERLARCLHAAIFHNSPFLEDVGVSPARDPFLRRLRAPAVTVLPEYITSHMGEGLLRDVSFQERFAQSLFDGLVAFFLDPPAV